MVKTKQQTKSQPAKKQNSAASTAKHAAGSLVSPSTSVLNQQKSRPFSIPGLPSCCGCGMLISDEVKALQCDKCQSDVWKCTDCLALTPEVYDQLISLPSCGLRWYCDSCDKTVNDNDSNERINKLVSVVEKLVNNLGVFETKLQDKSDVCVVMQLDTRIKLLEDNLTRLEHNVESRMVAVDGNIARKVDHVEARIRKLEEQVTKEESDLKYRLAEMDKHVSQHVGSLDSRMDAAETNLADVRSSFEGLEKSQPEADKYEEQEIELRKTSVIIHGIAEPTADTADERIETDLLQVAAMLQELKLTEVKVEKLIRLGKRLPDDRNDETEPKPRPLKVVLDSEENKIRVIRNAKNLRNAKDGGWVRVFVHQDLTPKQREARNKLVQELKARLAQGEKDLIIYRGTVMKRKGY